MYFNNLYETFKINYFEYGINKNLKQCSKRTLYINSCNVYVSRILYRECNII